MARKPKIELTREDRRLIIKLIDLNTNYQFSERSQILLMLSEGSTYKEIEKAIGYGRGFLSDIKKKFLQNGISCIFDKPGKVGGKILFSDHTKKEIHNYYLQHDSSKYSLMRLRKDLIDLGIVENISYSHLCKIIRDRNNG